jgi:hypothetical protein
MAMKKLESLVLRVVPVVVRDVVAGLETIGTSQAMGQAPMVTLSFARHLPPGNPDGDPNPRARYEPANYGAAHSAQRAGRSGSPAGVPDSQTAAITARSAILSGWSVAVGGIRRVSAGWRGLKEVTTAVATDGSLSGRSQPRKRLPAPRHARAEIGAWSSGRKCLRDGPGAKAPARGMPLASFGGR